MELRKNPELDLERRRGMFFSFGLLLSMAFVLTAFQWKVEKGIVVIPDIEEDEDIIYMIDPIATRMEQPKPPKPEVKRIVAPVYVPTPDIVDIIDEPEIESTSEPDDFEIAVAVEPDEEKAETFVDYAEEMPTPEGGYSAFYKYLNKNMKYPRFERNVGVQGKVYVRFIIDKDGSITDLEVIKSVSKGLDNEALRVLSEAPSWNPGKQGHLPVRVRMVLPITFRLN